MRSFQFYQLDVFTNKAFEGNPLAVFPEVAGLASEEMQKIALEMNLSETVFVMPSEKALRHLRIFTPRQEIPMAGHPVVGTWNLLARLGVVSPMEAGWTQIEHEIGIGVLPVDIEFKNQLPSQVVMTQGKFECGPPVSDEALFAKIAEALGLKLDDLDLSGRLPFQAITTGLKALAVPVKTLDALGQCHINSSLLAEIYLSFGTIGCYAFTLETLEKDASGAHARFFAPADNIPEDPATGSAAGALSSYLVYHGAIETTAGMAEFTIEQGDFMNRPSRIFAQITGGKGNIEKVRIGGESIVVAKGEVLLD